MRGIEPKTFRKGHPQRRQQVTWRHRKTFVTTDLQKAIAEKSGIRCVETLTGFVRGEKLQKLGEDPADSCIRRFVRRRHAKAAVAAFFPLCFGGEESYGYSGSDFVRDKDGNSAVVMIAEVAAYAKSQGTTLVGLLDRIFSEFGFYLEQGESLTMEGAEGAAQIKKLVDSYAIEAPTTIDGAAVSSTTNFATGRFMIPRRPYSCRSDAHDHAGRQ